MKLLVIRHAAAEDRDAFAHTGRHDDLRPTTPEGRKRMQAVSRGLRRLVPELHLLASSPLVRARQTAGIVARAYPDCVPRIAEELSPDHKLPAFLRWIRAQEGFATVGVVGHEPHLSHLISWLLAGRFTSFVRLKKGAACLLEFPGEPSPAEGRLLWLLQPGELRRVGRS